MAFSKNEIDNLLKEKWGNRDNIKTNLLLLKSEESEIMAFSKKVADLVGVELSDDPIENQDFNTLMWALLVDYKIPVKESKLNAEYDKIQSEKRKNAQKTWNDTYGLFIMPECTGYILDLLDSNMNVLLVGPKGSGKTECSKIIYENILNVNFTSIDITPNMTRFDLEGIHSIETIEKCQTCSSTDLNYESKQITCNNCGTINNISILETKSWEDGLLSKACRDKASIIFNEIDASGEDLSTGLMQLFQDHKFVISQTGEALDCNNINIIGTANTIGNGNNEMYNRQFLDKAFLSRMVPIYIQYPPKEKEIKIIQMVNPNINSTLSENLVIFADSIRNAHNNGSLTDIISTRELVHFARMYQKNDRWDLSYTLKICLCNRFNPEEIRIVLQEASKIFNLSNLENIII